MSFSIIITSSYQKTEVGLYKNFTCIDRTNQFQQASTFLIPTIDELLKKNNIKIKNISFIAAYQGPGAFTTLRVMLASINGIAFANNMPLIGIDGLEALLEENTHVTFSTTIALLNAYNNDAYFGIQHNGKILEKGCQNILELLNNIKSHFKNQQLRFVGQGVDIFKKNILDTFDKYAYIPSPIPEEPSLDILALKAQQIWQEGHTTRQLLPLYLKSFQYKKSIV